MSLTNFVRKVSPVVAPQGKFHLYTFEEQVRILSNYFKALENVFPKEFDERTMRFLGTLGFGAIINVLPTVFDLALKNYNGFTVEDAVKVLKTVERFNFSDWDQHGTGSASEIRAGQDLRDTILAQMEQQEQPGSLRL